MVRFAVLSLIILMGLSGCATLSREQCQRGDWYGLGLRDGQDGEPASRLDQHLRACSGYGIQINDRQYFDGREQGLREYCRLENAVDLGLRGRRYQGVCPPPINLMFERCNSVAFEIYRLREELDRMADQITAKEDRLLDRSLSDEARHHLRHEIRDMDATYLRLRDDLHFSKQRLDSMQRECQPVYRP